MTNKESNLDYIVFFVDEDGQPTEWAASSTSLPDALHYLNVYAQDGKVGLFTQQEPKPFVVDGKNLVKG